MTENDILKVMEETGALLSGHFELRSKLHSDRFFQCANVLRFPRAAERLCSELVRRMKVAGGCGRIDGVLSPALGGIIIGHEVARALDVPSLFAEKENNLLTMRRFKIEPGHRYIVAEDVVTRGGRVQECIDIIKNAGAEVAAVLVLVDRSGGTVTYTDHPFFSLLNLTPKVWEPSQCPLCAAGSTPVHPGS
ncbi:MAG: orotate phosphoribosyltransferase [Lentisphaerae bacterium]|nr:orotate phosphoribosyltransferase [Lentisphaerota bacterium]